MEEIEGGSDLRTAATNMINKISETGEYLLTMGSGFVYSEIGT